MDEPHVVDLSGRTITPGSYVIDDRGKAWRVLQTESTFRQQRLMRVVDVRITRGVIADGSKHTYARAYMTFIVDDIGTQPENQVLWHRRYDKEVRPRKRAEVTQRRLRVRRGRQL